MEKEIDTEVIKSTQILLGKFVKRPPLSEKLLRKPPFRFLHDIITTVLKTTGFFENLFEEDELVSDNVKDRDGKIAFLNKVIFVLSVTTGKSLSAKPSKIVAGQEAEKTNELLQCLALALDEKLSSHKAVKQYKDSIKTNQTNDNKHKDSYNSTKKSNDTKKLASRSSEKLTLQKSDLLRSTTKVDKEKSNDVKSKKKENPALKNELQPSKKILQTKKVSKKSAKESKDPQSQHNIEIHDHIEKENTSLTKLKSQDSDVSIEKEDQSDIKLNVIQIDSAIMKQIEEDKINSSYTLNDLNSSASSNEFIEKTHANLSECKSFENDNKEVLLTGNDTQNQANIRHDEYSLKSLEIDMRGSDKVKPSSALKEKEHELKTIDLKKQHSLNEEQVSNVNDTKFANPPNARPSSVRPSSSRPGAPRMREKVDNVIKETDNLLMAKVNIIVENTNNEEEEDTSPIIIDQLDITVASQDQQELQLSSSEHGHLVQQILDSQKELNQISGKTEIEWQFGAQKAREAMNQDIEQLRFNIQALSRVANPLGKLLDHIQEDVEVMRQELQQWSNIYEDVIKEVHKQKTLNEDSLTPFHSKLKQLEGDIEEKHDKITDLKIMIHRNSIRIEKLLTGGNLQ